MKGCLFLCNKNHRSAFTLIELLVVIAVIAILAVVVILVINPAELLRQSRDANRLSDMSTLNASLGVYAEDVGGSMGNGSTTYISITDLTTTSTLGNQCQGLGLAALSTSTGQNYQCAASSTPRKVNGTGWIPINFSAIASGAPIGNLPVDPSAQTSTNLFYTYTGNGTLYEVTTVLESQKYRMQYAANSPISTYPEVVATGNDLSISNLFSPSGLAGYWPFDDGSSTIAADKSGNGGNGTWGAYGSPITYAPAKIGSYAGNFPSGNTVQLSATGSSTRDAQTFTISAWAYSTGFNAYPWVYCTGDAVYTNSPGVCLTMRGVFGNPPELDIWQPAATLHAVTSTITLAMDQWQFIAGTYDGATMKIYANGVLGGSFPYVGGYSTPTNPGRIGSNQTGNYTFNGYLDDVRIYNRALSPAEILAIYNAQK